MDGKKIGAKKTGGHCHNLVTIKDEKYNIDGVYVEDATWDSKNNSFPYGKGFAHCLYPVCDVMHLNEDIYVQDVHSDRYRTIMRNDGTDYQNKLVTFIKSLQLPPIIKKYSQKSKPISEEAFRKGLGKIFYIKTSDQTVQEALVEEAIKNSAIVSKKVFDDKASSCFVRMEKGRDNLAKVEDEVIRL